MDEIVKQVIAHSRDAHPSECCGLVVKMGETLEYVRCPNVADDPSSRFVISPENYAEVEDSGEILMIAHSHNYLPPHPSEADKVGIEQSGLPWLIVNYPIGTHTITHPSGFKAPLLGRKFCKGSVDCYALVRDYYDQELGIDLPNYERPEVWHEVGRSILIENFSEFGFSQIDPNDMRPNDCLLMQVGSSVPNHCAVYLGDNKIFHHVKDRLSSRDVYGSFWRRATTHVLRYDA